MEKILSDLEATWTEFNLSTEIHEPTAINLAVPGQQLIETLENNQVQLQNLMSSRYVSFFLNEISQWQDKLANADQVIHALIDVQRVWANLYSIFMLNNDIQGQFPQHHDLFKEIDALFRVK